MKRLISAGVILCGLAAIAFVWVFAGATPAQAGSSAPLSLVVVVTRHGVRASGSSTELAPYSAQAWPKWDVRHSYLTAHGFELMRQFGVYYRREYTPAGVFPARGCPQPGTVYIWADVDERTVQTGRAIAQGLAPGCSLTVAHAAGDTDPLFDPVPAIAKADARTSSAATLGAIGYSTNAIVPAYANTFAQLDTVLGCSNSCKRVSTVPTTIGPDPDSGLASVNGGLDLAGTAAEDLLLEYAGGKPAVGWGRVKNAQTISQLMQLHALKSRIEHESSYNASAEGSNILAAIGATLNQGAGGQASAHTKAPASAKFVVFSGHDTTLSLLAGLLHLSWLMQGYQLNDTPPGGALVFELYQPVAGQPFVRLFFVAQSLDQMRAGDGTHPARVPVYVPGCPSLDCPLTSFNDVLSHAIDPHFVASWH